jgi:dihydroxyacetone kinase
VFLSHVASAVASSMDGTSGALFGIFTSSLVNAMVSLSPASKTQLTTSLLAKGLKQALDNLSNYTPARPGGRTLMDALVPFVDELAQSANVQKAADAAKTGSDGTKGMKPSFGRTVYVGGDDWKTVPDPGAYGVAILMEGFARGINKMG